MNTIRRYTFRVQGFLPPKKGMDLSMFSKPSEAEKIAALRVAALEAMHGDPPLQKDICLSLIVHVGALNVRITGDLDNFITGVCDGLQAALPNAKIAEIFSKPEFMAVHPARPIGMIDDVQVIEISARKVVGDTLKPWYEVTIEGE